MKQSSLSILHASRLIVILFCVCISIVVQWRTYNAYFPSKINYTILNHQLTCTFSIPTVSVINSLDITSMFCPFVMFVIIWKTFHTKFINVNNLLPQNISHVLVLMFHYLPLSHGKLNVDFTWPQSACFTFFKNMIHHTNSQDHNRIMKMPLPHYMFSWWCWHDWESNWPRWSDL